MQLRGRVIVDLLALGLPLLTDPEERRLAILGLALLRGPLLFEHELLSRHATRVLLISVRRHRVLVLTLRQLQGSRLRAQTGGCDVSVRDVANRLRTRGCWAGTHFVSPKPLCILAADRHIAPPLLPCLLHQLLLHHLLGRHPLPSVPLSRLGGDVAALQHHDFLGAAPRLLDALRSPFLLNNQPVDAVLPGRHTAERSQQAPFQCDRA